MAKKVVATVRWQIFHKDVSPGTRAKLVARAKRNLRSVPKEIIAIVNAAVNEDSK